MAQQHATTTPVESCEVCGVDIRNAANRCTNGRCLACHRAHCTEGGVTFSGHGRRWPAAAEVHS